MTRSARTIIDELLALDPSLKEHKEALIPLVEALLKADPAREPDAHFLSDLRSQLQQRAAVLSASDFSSSSAMSKFLYAFTGAAVAVVIAVPSMHYIMNRGSPNSSDQPLFAFNVTKTSPDAFGDLSGARTATMPTLNESGDGARSIGGANTVPAPSAVMAPMADGAMESNAALPPTGGGVTESYGMMDDKMIAPGEWTMYNYIFDGAIMNLPTGTVDVLKREKRFLSAPLSVIADRFTIGTIDLSAFNTAKLEYANFIQDKDYGYSINLNMRDASIGIGMNWEKWPQANCTDDACWKAQQITIDQVLADAELLSIAAKFVSDYGIDVRHYGTPYVDQTWKRDYDRMPNKAEAYIPDTLRVIYPLQIDGKDVHEQFGEKAGIAIGVNIKAKGVAEAWGIADQTYTSSAYDAVTDEKTVRDYLTHVEQNSLDPAMLRSGEIKTKTVKVTLGTPTLGYGRFYNYQANTQDELLVPSLIFPVVSAEDGSIMYRQSVVVPLAKDLLTQTPPQIMPYMMEDLPAGAVK